MDFAALRPRGGRGALLVTGAVLLALALFIVLFDWNWLRGPIAQRVRTATGRELSIGDLDVDLGLQTRVRAKDVRFANASWSKEPDMARVATVEFTIDVPALLRGRVDLPYLHLRSPHVLIESDQQGRGNWQFGTKAQQGPPRGSPVIHELTVDAGRLVVREARLKTNLDVTIRSLESGAAEHAPLVAAGKGTFRGRPFEMQGRIDSPLDLRSSDQPFHVDVRANAGETRVHASGASRTPLQFDAFAIQLDVAGTNMGDLWTLVGLPVPDTPPYSFQGRLVRDRSVWAYRHFKGRVGHSDIGGDAEVDISGKRPRVRATVASQNLDFRDLGILLNAPLTPQEPKPERVLPDKPYELDKFRVMDADVRYKAERIEAPKLPLERMSVHMVLEDGVAKFDPLHVDAAGGAITSRMSLDATGPSIATTLAAEVQHLELPKLFPTVEITKAGAGKVWGAIEITTQGNSVARMFASANGNVGLVMGPGRISNLLMELAGLDVAESLQYLLDKNKEVPLRCAYAAFKVEDGIARSQGLAFDTTDTLLFGQGTIDLREEKLDLRLEPKPKDVSPVSLRSPLHVGGTFRHPTIRPEAAPLAARVAAAAALYAIAPPAALLALVETGPGKGERVDCGPAQREGS